MKSELNGKVALVTGASRGIGKAIAMALLSEGVNVMAAARTKKALQPLMDTAVDLPGECAVTEGDLCDTATPSRLIDDATEKFGRLDILVNNAGILPLKTIETTTVEEWDCAMAINARAPFLLCQAALPQLRKSGCGTIIQIASVVGERSYIEQGAYTASKHALMGFSKVLAQEVKDDKIRVHTILPGGVSTDLTFENLPDAKSSELMAPEEIADIVMFLLNHRGNAVIDAVRVRRSVKEPWF